MKVGILLNNKEQALPVNGMDLYRMIFPYYTLTADPDFELHLMSTDEFDMNPLTYDVYVMNRSRELFRAERVKKEGKKLIVDIDDYWILPSWHPINPKVLDKAIKAAESHAQKRKDTESINNAKRIRNIEINAPANIIQSMRIADHVTCSVPQLAERIKEYNPNVTVIKNTIPDKAHRYTTQKTRSKFLRFGWLGGTFHGRDVGIMFEGMLKLHRDSAERGKYQFLSSFNLVREYIEIEKTFTCNYRFISKEYRELLTQYKPVAQHMGLHEPYRRIWSVPVEEYGSLYEEVDVSMIPLQHGTFNSMKSELKLVEAGATGCAAIVSDVMPYKPYLKHGVNCLKTSGTNGWYTAFKIMLNNPNLVADLREGLRETVRTEFDNETEANKLKQILKQL